MSMDRDLHTAVPQTPDFCRDAVLRATGTYREETNMRRPYKWMIAAALILALLCGTAYAVVNYYSVRDYVGQGQTSVAFEKNIVPLEKTVATNGLTFTLGDAIFDGRDLAFTMDLTAAEGASSLYIYPELTAWIGDTQVQISDFMLRKTYRTENGWKGGSDFPGGFFMPATDPKWRGMVGGNMGANVTLRTPAEEPVTWRYTLRLYRPTGETVEMTYWDNENETYEAWEERVRELHRQGKISVDSGVIISDYVNAVVDMTIDGRADKPFPQCIEETGLFELADTLVFEFTTAPAPAKLLAAGQTFTFEDFTLEVKRITQSVMKVEYEFFVTFQQKQAHEHYVEQFYEVFDQDGTQFMNTHGSLELADDKFHCTVTGDVDCISDTPLTALTFRLRPFEWPEGKAIPEFTVQLAK